MGKQRQFQLQSRLLSGQHWSPKRSVVKFCPSVRKLENSAKVQGGEETKSAQWHKVSTCGHG
jgi:hypothetical protein